MAIKALITVFLIGTLLQGCALPPLNDRTQSGALSPQLASETKLGKSLAVRLAQNRGKAGIYPIQDPKQAFAGRVALARAAERTIDIQSYLWHNDTTGTLMLNELFAAAQRGVRVRLLLDDNGITGLDNQLNRLDRHPNIEVRLFNPFVIRNPKWLGYITDFSRANRRMHNKSFTVDNMVTISGGRNIGDEYFGATDAELFTDLDMLCVGAVVDAVSRDFDLYWQSNSSYPSSKILLPTEPTVLDKLDSEELTAEQQERAAVYTTQVRESVFVQDFLSGNLQLQWTEVRMVSDDPAKGLDEASREDYLVAELRDFIAEPKFSLSVVSPYFVPTEKGVAFFSRLAKAGVNVQILTNSLEATDVAAVHSGYAKTRVELLKAGVKLFELKSSSGVQKTNTKRNLMLGNSGSSLHTKTFSVDSSRVFVGSFNFDPRSVNLNTEMGFLIQSESLATQIDLAFQALPVMAYEVRLDENDALVWIERQSGKEIVHNLEPKATAWRKAVVFFYSLLPINDLL
ncbi:phospholipase D family protein [Limnobacter sp.]|jgi:putative cardiolipin synthase|uniref:phospholipase D family protein n=1 Tax=Limnobacter sp. TaxID=2003368 RepID=UPI002735AC5A|nr:phospholipase D family protein [Limnobacter sp.]MDP3271291.1 phospholipase D family protein [Limnobacter sp.]